ncbi:peptidase MA family metallohydrolase [Anaerosolibacter sp.]|uniref:peptidase MA family metallohydrolase n=1 Tax=Anaerosolibacter sp. TaxID=1872527 RepID=UPI0039EF9D88
MKRVLHKKTGVSLYLVLAVILFLGAFRAEVLKVSLYPLFREVQFRIIDYKTKDFGVRETEHFIIKYQEADQEVIELVAEASEKHYDEASRLLNYYPKKKTTVVIYEDPTKLMKNANLRQGKPPMGVYYASTIQILSPRQWIPENTDMKEIFMNEGPMVHEFTHLLVDDLTRGNYPLWFTEGVALYQEYVHTGYEWGKGLEYEEAPYDVAQLTNDFHELDEMLAYKRSFEMMKSMVENNGSEDLNKVLRELGKGEDFEKAHEKVFDKTVETIYE